MIQNHRSPPKHRHDGTSPLPLGMDWSPAPRKWNGKETVWPHDPGTGWSYCVTIPSWVVRPKSRDSDPVVYYRVIVGLQSPEGTTSARAVLRRFNDFLKLFAALKKAFPQKSLPAAPPKGLLRIKTRAMLEERRCSLEEWMAKLLSDIDISRSLVIASFLELEAAARSSFQVETQCTTEASSNVNSTASSIQVNPDSGLHDVSKSGSAASDYGSEFACERSDVGSPSFGMDNNSEVGTDDLSIDEDFASPVEKLVKYGMSDIDAGLFMGETIMDKLEGFPSQKVLARERIKALENNKNYGSSSRTPNLNPHKVEPLSETENGKIIYHSRKLLAESATTDLDSLKVSGLSKAVLSDSFGNGFNGLPSGSNFTQITEINTEMQLPNNGHFALPLDHRQKLNRLLTTMQRRLFSAKTDMENLISRLNQEIAVKDYLTTKVKDLEVELEEVKERSKENLEQAMLIERERFTQMQWDMEELRQRSIELELKLKAQQDGGPDFQFNEVSISKETGILQQELDSTRSQLEDMIRRNRELELKSKTDIKVLVKEVKSLRSYQSGLKEQLNQSLKEQEELESHFQQERHNSLQSKTARKKLLHDSQVLRSQLHECHTNLFVDQNNSFMVNSPLVPDAMELLTRSDNQINLILAEIQHLALDDLDTTSKDDARTIDDELRKVLSNLLVDNATLRKLVNDCIRYALKIDNPPEKDYSQVDPSVDKTESSTFEG